MKRTKGSTAVAGFHGLMGNNISNDPGQSPGAEDTSRAGSAKNNDLVASM